MTNPHNPRPPDSGLPVDISLWRTLDAAANRAAEGLRVIEDFVRYGQNDAFLTGELKSLRHELEGALRQLDRRHCLQARDTFHDVGTKLSGQLEQARGSWADLLTANFKRLQQALRSLEEHAKMAGAGEGALFERLRYQTYSLEKMIAATVSASDTFPTAAVYVLIDGRENTGKFQRLVEQLLEAQTEVIQLRDKNLDDRTLLSRAELLCKLSRGTTTKAIINDRADIAKLALADGVHVGQEELTVQQARGVLGVGKLVGVSTHSIDQARQAVRDGADYIGVGPTFPSRTKNFTQFAGLDLVREVAAEITLPAFAIGGIDLQNVSEVASAGLRRIAVAGCVCSAASPGAVVRQLRKALEA